MVEGRWDLTIHDVNGDYPSWVDLSPQEGWFVGRFGSARPIPTISLTENSVEWALPKQYEGRETDLQFTGTLTEDGISGTTTNDSGEVVQWSGRKAPALPSTDRPVWGDVISLVQSDLSNWHPRSPEWTNQWSITANGLENAGVGTDLITRDTFGDFRLVAEYRYPKGSNSGIYLRGRYEFQILDDHGHEPTVGSSAAIYGFLIPSENAVHAHDEWNTAEITLLGRFITVVLNGKTVIENAEIPGITGGALESREDLPGPIFVQGDHGPVTFRKLDLYPRI
ncbi:Domain of unknown function DUF1080 [Fimbriimonadaceae bacterium]